ncbi:MAG TPA: alpha/beta fold hydrolase [Candidatus Saccharimonadales bacterium]|nr:alpha/beta fold hydrolase [Candidatus Saccharimonadales bacterium]
MGTQVSFTSDGVTVAAEYTQPASAAVKSRGVVLCHGFSGARYPKLIADLGARGYAVLAFDYRGYGRSAGERGRVVMEEVVADTIAATNWLLSQPEVDASCVALVGSSLGGSITIMAAAKDKRVQAVVSACPLAQGRSVLEMQYDSPDKWQAFEHRIEDLEANGGEFDRFEIVHIPEPLRSHLPSDSPMRFTPATARSFATLNVLDDIDRLNAIPLLLIHAKDDQIVSYHESERLAERASGQADLILTETGNHFLLGQTPVIAAIGDWLVDHYAPAAVGSATHTTPAG